MKRPKMLRNLVVRSILLLLMSCLPVISASAEETGLTQRDWMIELVNTLDLSFGLPDTPTDEDYILVLRGQRQFRFEAEDVYAPEEDEVSRMSFRNFGDFSGSAWLNGLSRPTRVQLRFTLPLSGRYRLSAGLRNGEHVFLVDGEQFTATATTVFDEVDIAEVELESGPQEIVVTLPSGGAIDYIELVAAGLAPISPLAGWQPDATLQWDDIRITLLQIFTLGDLLPATASVIATEAEQLELSADDQFTSTDIGYFGQPSAGQWLRAGAVSARLDVPIEISAGGFYQPVVRLLGNPVSVDINRQIKLGVVGRPYLENYSLPAQFFSPGTNLISLEFPPGGGLDRLSLTRLDSSPASGNRLLGLQPATPTPDRTALEQLTRLVAAFGTDR